MLTGGSFGRYVPLGLVVSQVVFSTSILRGIKLNQYIIIITGNHYANNQKDPYINYYIPIELALYSLYYYTIVNIT